MSHLIGMYVTEGDQQFATDDGVGMSHSAQRHLVCSLAGDVILDLLAATTLNCTSKRR